MKMDQIGLCQTWHVPRYEGSLRAVLSHSALQLNEFKKKGKAQLCSFINNSHILTVNTGLKWCGLHMIFSHKTGSERRKKNIRCDGTNFGDVLLFQQMQLGQSFQHLR